MRALFVTNQHKTMFYSAVGRRMEELGVPVYWVSLGERWSDLVRAAGFGDDRILPLYRHGAEWTRPLALSDEDRARLERIEKTAEAGLKNILVMDRELNRRSDIDPESYAAVVTREVERFVLAHDITHGFGEPTWAPEMLTSEVLRAHGRPYYMHHTIRVPSNRLALYDGIFHDKVAEWTDPTTEHREIARAAIVAVRDRGERPYYFKRNMNPQRLRPHWVDEAVRALAHSNEARFDYAVPDLTTRVRRRIKARIGASRAIASGLLAAAPATPTRPFVLVLLHKQPESSVDVFGAPFNNQLEAIRALARCLPFEWELWVKEHGHALGDRTLDYYRELAGIPGVRLIDAASDTMGLIRKAEIVASAAGTASFEAAIMGIPAVTFGRMFFGSILLADALDPFALDIHAMRDLIAKARRLRTDPEHGRRVEDLVTGLVAQSFEGNFSDPISMPEVLHPDNVDRIATATVRVMRQVRRRA